MALRLKMRRMRSSWWGHARRSTRNAMKYRETALNNGAEASRCPRNAQFRYGESLMIRRYSSHDFSVTTLYGAASGSFLVGEAIRIRVMIERSRSRVTAEAALFDSGKLHVQIPEYAMVVEKHCSRIDSIGHRFRP